ncbi:MAG: hypothetical protein HUJ75_07505 [Parasporobacterium sp.]|nr:hypothetical protein [Parasporobacterium sp.]
MTDSEKLIFIEYLSLREELDSMQYKGAQLIMDGKVRSSHAIASECMFNEHSDYMRNYVIGPKGRLESVEFSLLTPEVSVST